MQWPDFYPENCPPEEAEPASGTVYRLVRHDPPQAEDFRTFFQENPNFFEGKPTDLICKGHGVSVYTDPEDIKQLKERSKKFKNRHIAKGELNSTLGVIQNTPSRQLKSHHTWWLPIGMEPWLVFKIINK
ncbi:hypothetical protein C6497_17215 [Candidatus Poribacteria bacterium]|nr:MAG: hypothetical protein C6497_17215 [Candidatus Poribacteria bacterium]